MVKNKKIIPIDPKDSKIQGVIICERNIFYDERGFLIETFAQKKEKDTSVYSYNSFTRPDFARDIDRFHFHNHQKDRFTVILGKMWILLYDNRKNSPSFGILEVIEAKGGSLAVEKKTTIPVYTITIPEGVYHGIKNPGPDSAILVNHPTAEYNPEDEGRILFKEVPVLSLGGTFFSWDLVQK